MAPIYYVYTMLSFLIAKLYFNPVNAIPVPQYSRYGSWRATGSDLCCGTCSIVWAIVSCLDGRKRASPVGESHNSQSSPSTSLSDFHPLQSIPLPRIIHIRRHFGFQASMGKLASKPRTIYQSLRVISGNHRSSSTPLARAIPLFWLFIISCLYMYSSCKPRFYLFYTQSSLFPICHSISQCCLETLASIISQENEAAVGHTLYNPSFRPTCWDQSRRASKITQEA